MFDIISSDHHPQSSIETLRTEVDRIDRDLLSLLAERSQIALRIAAEKQRTNKPVRDTDREHGVLTDRTSRAARYQLDMGFVYRIWEEILADSVRIQRAATRLPTNEATGTTDAETGVLNDHDTVKNVRWLNAPSSNDHYDSRYKLASRSHVEEDTVVKVGQAVIGGPDLAVIAGPCAVESRDQVMATARAVKHAGATMLRGGCFKPRTSPYSFQGLGYEGLEMLAEAGEAYDLPIVTEVPAPDHVEKVAEVSDVLQVGARNMQNFPLLAEVGSSDRPVLLKRAMSGSIDELLQAAEYILAAGNQRVILCERGIRTFETSSRNTLDLTAVPVLRERTHLPVVVDPSHAAGDRRLVTPLAIAAAAVGADGLMVEVHPKPSEALSDGPQALTFDDMAGLMRRLAKMAG